MSQSICQLPSNSEKFCLQTGMEAKNFSALGRSFVRCHIAPPSPPQLTRTNGGDQTAPRIFLCHCEKFRLPRGNGQKFYGLICIVVVVDFPLASGCYYCCCLQEKHAVGGGNYCNMYGFH